MGVGVMPQNKRVCIIGGLARKGTARSTRHIFIYEACMCDRVAGAQGKTKYGRIKIHSRLLCIMAHLGMYTAHVRDVRRNRDTCLWEGGQHQTKPRISGFGLLQHKPNPGFLGLVWETGRFGTICP